MGWFSNLSGDVAGWATRTGRDIKDGAGDLWNDATGVTASRDAARAQKYAADKAATGIESGFAEARGIQQPFLEGGTQDYGRLRELVASGAFDMPTEQYQPGPAYQDPTFNFQADPGYQFRVQQGTQAANRALSARGGALGGGALKELTRFGQGLGSEEYGAAFNRFDRNRAVGRGNFENDRDFRYGSFSDGQARRSNELGARFGRLSGLADVGVNTARNLGDQRMGVARNLADLTVDKGNAQAAGRAAQYNNQRDTLMGLLSTGANVYGSYAGARKK